MSNGFQQSAIDYQEQAARSSELARKHLFALIDDTLLTWMQHPVSQASKISVAGINQRDSRAFYACARDAMNKE
jgi:hypothetical protein